MSQYKYVTKKYTDLTEIENALKEIGEDSGIIEIALERIKRGHWFLYFIVNEFEGRWRHYRPTGEGPYPPGYLIIKKRL